MTPEQKLHVDTLIPYRMKAVDTFNVALVLNAQLGIEGAPMQIKFNDVVYIEGNSHGWTNPAIECGLVHCRTLLEFLGLKADKDGKKLVTRSNGHRDDIVIEDFTDSEGNPLSRLTVEDAAKWAETAENARYVDWGCNRRDDIEEALARVVWTASKWLAHTTSADWLSEENRRYGKIASLCIPELVGDHLYSPMGLPVPNFMITHRTRSDPQE